MIEQVDERLQKWVKSVVGETAVSFTPPTPNTDRRVSLYLLELADLPPLRGAKRPPLQLQLRYLVTTAGESPTVAHQLLGRLVFAAMQEKEYEVLLETIDPTIWTAFGMPPLPAFILGIPLKINQDEKPPPLVRAPLDVVGSPVTQLNGIVLGPGDIPIANARVEYPALQRTVRTDHQGRFQLTAVPATPATKNLKIVARGQEQLVEVTLSSNPEEPVIILFMLGHES